MKIKYINKVFIIASILLATISCNEFLDVAPDNRALLDTDKKITSLLVSAYPEQSTWLLCELSSDNADDNGGTWETTTALEKQAFTWSDATEIEQDSPQSIWDGYYHAIASANQALQAIHELGDPQRLDAQKGEALMCRAYCHFVLANVFCKSYGTTSSTDLGIPYMDKTETKVSPHYERGNVADVYAKIGLDLKTALPLIDDQIYSVPKYHFNRKAAYAFATRFNLYYRNYDKVIEYANIVLTDDPVSVLRDWQYGGSLSYNDKFRPDWYIGKDNRATLLNITTQSLWGRVCGAFFGGSKYAHNEIIASFETVSSSGPWGSAGAFYYNSASYSGIPKVISRTFDEYFEYSDPVNGIGLPHIIQTEFTTDETLLCRAEAYALTKQYDNATKDLSAIMKAYSSAGSSITRSKINSFYGAMAYYTVLKPTAKKQLYPDFSIETGEQENFIDCVLHMRRILTIHQGLRWFDVKRYGIKIYRRTVDKTPIIAQDSLLVNDPRRAIQLPQNVINAGITANPR
ncbi:MAG: RagB/SusD family nutrient uptake outer membrane protein [Paludibacter sp.]